MKPNTLVAVLLSVALAISIVRARAIDRNRQAEAERETGCDVVVSIHSVNKSHDWAMRTKRCSYGPIVWKRGASLDVDVMERETPHISDVGPLELPAVRSRPAPR